MPRPRHHLKDVISAHPAVIITLKVGVSNHLSRNSGMVGSLGEMTGCHVPAAFILFLMFQERDNGQKKVFLRRAANFLKNFLLKCWKMNSFDRGHTYCFKCVYCPVEWSCCNISPCRKLKQNLVCYSFLSSVSNPNLTRDWSGRPLITFVEDRSHWR